jgi:nucleoside-diphosphate-sugar epimerase
MDYSELVNVQSTGELAERFRDTSKGKFVYVSTSHVYAKSSQPIHEDYILEPTSTYADQKLRAEMSLTSVFKDQPQKLLIVRVFSILDWGMPAKTLGATIENIKKNIPDVKVKNADDIRDFLTPFVVGKSISALVQEFNISGCINLCSGIGTSVRNATIQMLGPRAEKSETNFIKGNSTKPVIVGSNSRLIALDPKFRLSWTPGLDSQSTFP